MAKYTGPKCKLCRRERMKLFLKGQKCDTEKCALVKRNFPPGQKNIKRRLRYSVYARQVREKQKVKRIYGVLEKQFRQYYNKATLSKGITGQNLLALLESRLDNVVYVAGLCLSRNHSRQLIRQGKINVNNKQVNIPSYIVKVGDIINVGEKVNVRQKEESEVPGWLIVDNKKKSCKVKMLPKRDDISNDINEQLIVEYYSR